MKKNSFLTHLNTLKPREVRKFGIYLHATFPNSKMLLKSYNYYIKFYNKKKPSPEFPIAYKSIYGKSPTSKNDITNLQNNLSDLFLKLKDYMIQLKVLETKFEKEFLWLKILEERGLAHQNKLHLDKLKNNEEDIQNIWASVELLAVYHYEFFRNDFQKHNPQINSLQKGLVSLEEFYKSMKLKFAAEIINRKQLLPNQHFNPDLDVFISDLEKINMKELSKNSKLYFTLSQFLKGRNQKSYQALKIYLINNHSNLHNDEKLTTIIYMINYLAEKIKEGDSKMMKEAFEIYQFGITNKVFISNGKMPTIPFYNIVNTACFFKKYDWARAFIKNYKKYISSEIRDEIFSVATIMILFKEKRLKEILPIYKEIKFTNPLSKISGTIYYLMSIYEIGDFDNLYTPHDTFTKYLKTNKAIGKINKEAALSFNTILGYFIRQRFSKKQIKDEIENKKLLFFRTWLNNQLNSYQQY
jgi:hypothetical protein